MSGDTGLRTPGLRALAHAIAALLAISTIAVGVGAGPRPAAARTPEAGGLVSVGAEPVALNQPADPFLGHVTPSATAATEGMFGPQMRWPAIPLQAVLMPSGRLVTYGSPIGVAAQQGLAYDVWNPALGGSSAAHVQTTSMHDYDSFCSGMQRLPDGRLVMIGGNSTMSTMLFDPTSRKQTAGPAMRDQRWYASTLRLTDDRILVLGGADYYNTHAFQKPTVNKGIGLTPEIGSGTGAWTALTGASSTTAFGAQDNRWWYPRAYNGPGGTVVGVSADQVWSLDVRGTGKLTKLGTLPTSIGISGSSALVRPGRLLVAGGGQQTNSDLRTATKAATLIDFSGTKATITSTAALATARHWGNMTVLADGRVLMNGGTVVGTKAGAGNAAYRAEVYDPDQNRWSPAATAQRIRTYHSTSLLMPSGAVFTGGGGIPGPEDNLNAELYYPSYLFAKQADGTVTWADRPTIESMSGDLTWGGRVRLGLGDDRAVASASLISLGAVTHSYNADQRYVPLSVTQDGDAVSLDLPTDRSTLPPGSYLLQVKDADGVPSPAQIITLRRDAAGQVTLQQQTQAQGGGQSGDTTSVGVVPLTPGSAVSVEPYDQWGYRVRANARTGAISTGLVTSLDPVGDRRGATFFVRPGLAGGGTVSLESAARAGMFLSVQGGRLVGKGDATRDATRRRAASFAATTGLSGQFTSLRSGADGSGGSGASYLRRKGSTVVAATSNGSDDARQQSTFAIRPALVEQRSPSVAPRRPGGTTVTADPSRPTAPMTPVIITRRPTTSRTAVDPTTSAGRESQPCCKPEDGDDAVAAASGSAGCHC